MNKNEKPSFFKRKGAAAGIVLCFVAVIAMAGTYTFNNYRNQMEEQAAEAQRQAAAMTEDNSEEANTDDIVLPEADDTGSDEADVSQDKGMDQGTSEADSNSGSEGSGAEGSADAGTIGNNGNSAQSDASETSASGVWFNEDSSLAWPASGAVLIGYSMDQTVFFQTLEQYKYNPALIIGGEVGETINASASGIVAGIEETAQTGTTVTLDMGNGYTAIYGQLKDVPVSEGDYVEAGNTVGYLNEPTKYYSVEGPNLYFEVQKDGEPVNPLNFME